MSMRTGVAWEASPWMHSQITCNLEAEAVLLGCKNEASDIAKQSTAPVTLFSTTHILRP